MEKDLKGYLDQCVANYNQPNFIENDPISIPHRFTKLQDIEIAGFWVAMLSWGQRKTIIQSACALIERMDGAPHDFMLHHTERDRSRFESFYHRTFQPLDALYFLAFLQDYYRQHDSLESAFTRFLPKDALHVEAALRGFHELFFSLPDAPQRTRKHVATPARKSTCKRLNMFLRWMVRHDEREVDFGVWKGIHPRQLLIPLDVHVERVARKVGLLHRKQTDWQAVLDLTEALRLFDPEDPVKYDYALFGLGVLEKSLLTKKGAP
ncbi:MAG: TIGR02757 family protein [Saprospirales bacterium]|nr:TIGR02757 family protein [Saprospirales bacterium]